LIRPVPTGFPQTSQVPSPLASLIACCPARPGDALPCAEAIGTEQDMPVTSSADNNNDFLFIAFFLFRRFSAGTIGIACLVPHEKSIS
jgi:hypothetical protein